MRAVGCGKLVAAFPNPDRQVANQGFQVLPEQIRTIPAFDVLEPVHEDPVHLERIQRHTRFRIVPVEIPRGVKMDPLAIIVRPDLRNLVSGHAFAVKVHMTRREAEAQTRGHERHVRIQAHLVAPPFPVPIHHNRARFVPLEHQPVQDVPGIVPARAQRNGIRPRHQTLDGLEFRLCPGDNGIQFEPFAQFAQGGVVVVFVRGPVRRPPDGRVLGADDPGRRISFRAHVGHDTHRLQDGRTGSVGRL